MRLRPEMPFQRRRADCIQGHLRGGSPSATQAATARLALQHNNERSFSNIEKKTNKQRGLSPWPQAAPCH